ncbi:fructosamine kinase family protein [Streptomyces sp. col6]|uniref:fructosamine kinase family protein n=1 Tax=Streptomyces sp. col6 TaxID=2478958 RepID=UPI001CD04CB0|nr:fructosamine kinase family protein [Streptomyces sp. col6]
MLRPRRDTEVWEQLAQALARQHTATRHPGPDGRPALIDPAVSYTWAEVDLAHLWTTAPPPEAHVFFEVYAELAGLDRDWRARMPILQLRQHLAVIAQFSPDWGTADLVRAALAPFRRLS